MNYIEEYYNKILNKEILTSERVYIQYKKLVETINNPGQYVFDEDKATKPIKFIETFCRHSKGKWIGEKIELDLWQKAYIQSLYGFVDKDTGLRQYKESMLLVGRKNGKSTLLAGLGIYSLVADNEGGAEINIIATKKDQAEIVFDEMHNMIKQSPLLKKHIRKRRSDLYFDLTFSKAQPLGRNADSLDGLNSSLVIIDELHAIYDRELYEVMQQSQSAREQPLLLMITTAGTVRESIYDNMYEMATNIVDGIFEDKHFLPMLYELDDINEWQEEKNWIKANPGLNSIKNIDDLRRKVKRANKYKNELPSLLCKDFNMKQNSSTAWLPYDVIKNKEVFNSKDYKGVFAIGGFDGGKVDDLSCATLMFLDKEHNKIMVDQMYWIAEDTMYDRITRDKIPYDIWKEQGWLRTTPGNITDFNYVIDWFNEKVEEGITPLWIGYDPWQATNFKSKMENLGFNMIPIRQGAKTMSIPMQTMEKHFESKKINYNNNPILLWNLSNAKIEEDKNSNISLMKKTNRKQKIDGVASLINSYVIYLDKYQEYINSF